MLVRNVNFGNELGPERTIDEEPLEAPFHLGPIPQQFDTGDNHEQDIIHAVIERPAVCPQADHVQRFHAIPAKETKLSALRAIYDQKRTDTALKLLTRRRYITVDNEFKVQPHDNDVLAYFKDHYIDYMLFIGNRTGLDAALPNIERDHTFNACINLCSTNRLWPSSNLKDLPFDAMGRMLYIGTRRQEQMWIAMIPRELISRDGAMGDSPKLDAATTALSKTQALVMIMFFAYALDKIRYRDVHCTRKYPLPITRENVKRVTNVL